MLFNKKLEIEKRIHNSLDEIEAQIAISAFPIIKKELMDYIKNNRDEFRKAENSEEYKSFDPFRWSGEELIFMGISILGSGKYHMHRGLLNPLSEGPELRSIVLKTIDLMVDRNYYTEDNRNDLQFNLGEAIRTVG